MTIQELQDAIHTNAINHGWWPDSGASSSADSAGRNFGMLLALVHSEVSEALEAWRVGQISTMLINGKPEGVWTEIADVVIRCLDMAEAHGVDLGAEIERKHAYNLTRPFKHGGKRA